ncbi:hypothetical protein BIW11_06672, partial [Tropilaelaps mercedesae]
MECVGISVSMRRVTARTGCRVSLLWNHQLTLCIAKIQCIASREVSTLDWWTFFNNIFRLNSFHHDAAQQSRSNRQSIFNAVLY